MKINSKNIIKFKEISLNFTWNMLEYKCDKHNSNTITIEKMLFFNIIYKYFLIYIFEIMNEQEGVNAIFSHIRKR